MDGLLDFRRFTLGDDDNVAARCLRGAMDKLHTLYPGKRITTYDNITLGVETDSLYSETGRDIYELGLVDDELPAMRCVRTGEVLTFRER
jgi:hypothetical protein